jgi:ubiquinone/menaquinone biosynthesis C-methylase UbiE
MKPTKDNFSIQSKGYSRFRPTYPMALYDELLSHVGRFGSCWDCATGNGQMAHVLADRFERVEATDISQQQLDKAEAHARVHYSLSRAEHTAFEADSFDLITVGQAIHWFDFDAFHAEVTRVSKNGGLLAVVGYGLMFVNEAFDKQLMQFYDGTIGSYWDPERKHIDSHYESIPFPFEAIELKQKHSIDVTWTLAQLEGYLNTWSSVNRFIEQNGHNPVTPFIQELRDAGIWNDGQELEVHFPLFVKLGRVSK